MVGGERIPHTLALIAFGRLLPPHFLALHLAYHDMWYVFVFLHNLNVHKSVDVDVVVCSAPVDRTRVPTDLENSWNFVRPGIFGMISQFTLVFTLLLTFCSKSSEIDCIQLCLVAIW